MTSASVFLGELRISREFHPRRPERRWLRETARVRAMPVIVVALAAVLLGPASAVFAVVVSDNFSDGNDTANPTWTHMDGLINSTGRVWDASTGQYYMHTNNDSTNPGVEGRGFFGSYVEQNFTDVRVAVDIVDFSAAQLENPTPYIFGVGARLRGVNDLNSDGDFLDANEINAQPTPENGLSLRGYMYGYEPFESFGSPTGGEMVLYQFDGGGPTDVRSEKVHLDNTKDYRFVLEVVGSTLHGQVFNLTDGGILIAEQFRDVAIEPQDGEPVYTNGYSGVFGIGSSIAGADAQLTVDNFQTETLAACDYNHNGVTDAGDYVLWRKTLGKTGPNGNPPTSFNDMRANGAFSVGYTQTIEANDYDFWRAHFGASTAGGSGLGAPAGVPEPASAVLGLIGLVSIWCIRRRF
jgi:hypothetical protein